MRNKTLSIVVIGTAVWFSGCSSAKPAVATADEFPTTVETSSPSEMGPEPPKETIVKSSTTAKDGSKVVVTADPLGNQFTVRTIPNHPRVGAIKVDELASGEVIVSVVGKDGAVVKLSPHLKAAALNANPDDFANMAGFADPNQPSASTVENVQTASSFPTQSPEQPAAPVSAEPIAATQPVEPIKSTQNVPKPVEDDRNAQLRRDLNGLGTGPSRRP